MLKLGEKRIRLTIRSIISHNFITLGAPLTIFLIKNIIFDLSFRIILHNEVVQPIIERNLNKTTNNVQNGSSHFTHDCRGHTLAY